jgi:hypothetical protein
LSHAPRIAAALVALGLVGCASPSAPPPAAVPVTPETQGEIAKYLRVVKVTRPGAFAVSPDGRNSFYTWCNDTASASASYTAPALRGCQSISGTPCVVLYVRNEPRLAMSPNENAAPGGRHGSEQQRQVEFDVRDR